MKNGRQTGKRKATAAGKRRTTAAAGKATGKATGKSATLTSPDIIPRIMQSRATMSKGERRLAEAVLADMEFAAHAAATRLAKLAGVSVPTVSRFCRTLGYGGMADFRLALAKNLSVGKRYFSSADPHKNGKFAGAVLQNIHDALNILAEQISTKDFRRAAALLSSAQRVFVFGGGGGASTAAQDAEYRLFRLGIPTTCCNDAQLQQMMAATLKKGDVLWVISTGGRYLELVKAAEIARQYNAHVIALTASDSPLAKTATLPLLLDIPEGADILLPTASRYALLACIDIIAAFAAHKIGGTARENLRRIKYQLVTLRDGEDSRPLGD